ncbi:hypothetical protein P4493_06330 [Bacillus thuringiensis]|jgi:hypothetical protein|uniref:Uncharacterized protein n=3 Tax=Bacillus thuringiensis TaxID=1428 RepID=A0A0B5NP19_BACTU|nr:MULTISPECIES: hypothetical protein [Bacillus]MEC2533180.1 hypothetical protein [Bacillus cereus]MED1153838.1 hypothetical protein [Bacillus paranthracis]OUB09306.1 hypothetical protein BK708_32785 [Bacillus thuringiensis serovar yunnanensis]AFQ30150.1 hypothetical protein BTF1_30247 [Bacillus thuringiensis HD-789]AJG73873.1 hypothetical protein BF38_5954 [Bacillus thuringiensis]
MKKKELKGLSKYKLIDTRNMKQYTIQTRVKGEDILVGTVDNNEGEIQMTTVSWEEAVKLIRDEDWLIAEKLKTYGILV